MHQREEAASRMLRAVHTVATITPVLNDATDLPAAIGSIQAQRGADIGRIVLALGPSSDGTQEVAAELAANDKRVILVENPSGRTPNGLNLAIAEADTDVVVRVDARSVLPLDYVCNALETLNRSGAGNVGAVQNAVGETLAERAIAAAMLSRAGSGGAAYRGGGEPRRVDTAWLGVFRRDVLNEVGGYDEDFTRNQDAELNIRLNAGGHEVWLDPRLVVDYRPRSTLSGLSDQYFQYGWWRQKTVQKHPGTMALRQAAAPVIVISLLLSLALAVLFSPRFLVVPAVYLAAVLGAGLATEGPVAQRIAAAGALVAMHLSWGTGFLLSALRSVVSGG